MRDADAIPLLFKLLEIQQTKLFQQLFYIFRETRFKQNMFTAFYFQFINATRDSYYLLERNQVK